MIHPARGAMYEVWSPTGSAMTLAARFRLRADAVRHVRTTEDPASHAIRCPDGTWLRWSGNGGFIKTQDAPPEELSVLLPPDDPWSR